MFVVFVVVGFLGGPLINQHATKAKRSSEMNRDHAFELLQTGISVEKRVERIPKKKKGGEDTERWWRGYRKRKRVARIQKKGGEDREKGWRGHRNRVARIQKKASEDTEIRWRGYRKKDREDTEKGWRGYRKRVARIHKKKDGETTNDPFTPSSADIYFVPERQEVSKRDAGPNVC